MLNIAFFSNKISSIGGIEKITSNLANEFIKESNVFILTFEDNAKMAYKLDENVKIISLSKQSNKLKDLFLINKVLKKNKIDFLIIQDKDFGYFSYLRINKLSKYKIIFCDHSSFNYYFSNNITNEVERRRKYTKHADAVVVLTSDNVNLYKKEFGYKDKKVYKIPNFLDFENKNNKYDSSSKVITAVGRLHKQKRFDLLIKSFIEVNKKYPDWSLEIYGDGEEREKLQKQIDLNNLSQCVFLKGKYGCMDDAYLNKSFLCATSEFEGFGIMILEALNYNLPVITFDCLSGPSDMVEDNINGFLVKPLDVKELTGKLLNLINDEKLRITFSKNSFAQSQKFNKNAIILKWQNLFNSLK